MLLKEIRSRRFHLKLLLLLSFISSQNVLADHVGWGGSNYLGTFGVDKGFDSRGALIAAVQAFLEERCPGGSWSPQIDRIDGPGESASRFGFLYTETFVYNGGGMELPGLPGWCQDRGAQHMRLDCKDGFKYNVAAHPLQNSIECVGGQSRRPHPVDIGKKERGDCDEKPCPKPRGGNPIHLANGNKFQIETDYQSPQPGGISYRRYYNSASPGSRVRFGTGWNADYWPFLRVNAAKDKVDVVRSDGFEFTFNLVNQSWVAEPDITYSLESISDTNGDITEYRLILPDNSIETYALIFSAGALLTSKSTLEGLTTTLTYDLTAAEGGDDNPLSVDLVTDPYGKELRFKFNAAGNVEKVVDPAGNEIIYGRDSNDNLISVTYPDDTPGDPNDNPTRIYHYENTSFPNVLTGITDETGNRFATWIYDSEGRAISSEHGNGAERIDITYNPDGTTTVTDTQGRITTYTLQDIYGARSITDVSGDTCPECGTTKAITYDANGYVASRTDLNGNVTTYINNSRGLETSRTEAVGTPEERTITTEWHPTFRLPTKITEPGKMTTFTYDAQGRLLERKVSEQ